MICSNAQTLLTPQFHKRTNTNTPRKTRLHLLSCSGKLKTYCTRFNGQQFQDSSHNKLQTEYKRKSLTSVLSCHWSPKIDPDSSTVMSSEHCTAKFTSLTIHTSVHTVHVSNWDSQCIAIKLQCVHTAVLNCIVLIPAYYNCYYSHCYGY